MSGDPSTIPPDVPLLPPPPGRTSRFDNPDRHRQHEIINTIIGTLTIATLCVLIRLGWRKFGSRNLGWDDYTCAAALALVIAFNISVTYEVKYGLGLYDWDIRERDFLLYMLNGWLLWNNIAPLLYTAAWTLIKASFLLLLLRIFSQTMSKTRYTVWATLVFVVLYNLAFFLYVIFSCEPPIKSFISTTPGTCVDLQISFRYIAAQSGLQVFTDIIMLLLPMPIIWRLNRPWLHKLGVYLTITTGVFITAISILRFESTVYIITQPDPGITVGSQYKLDLWSIIETNIALVCSCMPAFKQLIVRGAPWLQSVASQTTPVLRNRVPRQTPKMPGESDLVSKDEWTERGEGSAVGGGSSDMELGQKAESSAVITKH